jgi:hypothetical protein
MKKQTVKKITLNRKTVALLKGNQMAVLNGGGLIAGQNARASAGVEPCPLSPRCAETFWQSCNCVM